METPKELLQHEDKYLPQAWEQYTLAELGWWVHLLTKRASMRSTQEGKDKDLLDASNYLKMMLAKVEDEKNASIKT